MANDDFFTVTDDWQAVEANGADITNGTFSVFSLGPNQVEFIKSDTLPTTNDGAARFANPEGSIKYTLGATENLFAKVQVTGKTVKIGVIPA